MRKIPQKLKEELSSDIFYKKCCIPDEMCNGRIEWHHNLIYGGKQINEKFCILPICHFHHEHEKNSKIGEKLDYIMWSRATPEQIKSYSKAKDYQFELERLKKIYVNN